MSNMAQGIASALTGQEIATSWKDIVDELDGMVVNEKQTETEDEVKSRLLAKLNGREVS